MYFPSFNGCGTKNRTISMTSVCVEIFRIALSIVHIDSVSAHSHELNKCTGNGILAAALLSVLHMFVVELHIYSIQYIIHIYTLLNLHLSLACVFIDTVHRRYIVVSRVSHPSVKRGSSHS